MPIASLLSPPLRCRACHLLRKHALLPFAAPAGLAAFTRCAFAFAAHCAALEASHGLQLLPTVQRELWPPLEQVRLQSDGAIAVLRLQPWKLLPMTCRLAGSVVQPVRPHPAHVAPCPEQAPALLHAARCGRFGSQPLVGQSPASAPPATHCVVFNLAPLSRSWRGGCAS